MAELAVTDGMPPPAGLPRGECICTRLDDGTIRIDQADPRILISAELLDAVALHGCIVDGTEAFALNARLDMSRCGPIPYFSTYGGGILTINGVNRRVIYRIGEYVPRVHGYIGEWPD
jgi:hypothetical protein